MPEKKTLTRARKDKREGKAPSTQAGEFVHEEIDHIRAGKHGARSTKQAIAIGLAKARRAGVALKPPRKAQAATACSASRQRGSGLATGRGYESRASRYARQDAAWCERCCSANPNVARAAASSLRSTESRAPARVCRPSRIASWTCPRPAA